MSRLYPEERDELVALRARVDQLEALLQVLSNHIDVDLDVLNVLHVRRPRFDRGYPIDWLSQEIDRQLDQLEDGGELDAPAARVRTLRRHLARTVPA